MNSPRFFSLALVFSFWATACISSLQAKTDAVFSANFKATPDGRPPSGLGVVTGGPEELFVLKGELRAENSQSHLLAVCQEPTLRVLKDYTVAARLRLGAGADVWGGVVARMVDGASFYHARLNTTGAAGTPEFQLYRIGGPGALLLGKFPVDYRIGTSVTVELTVKGGTQKAKLSDANGRLLAVIDASDETFSGGPAALRAHPGSSSVVFETLTVSKLE
jgi:hypothetical protein